MQIIHFSVMFFMVYATLHMVLKYKSLGYVFFSCIFYVLDNTGFYSPSCLRHSGDKIVSIATTQELGVGALSGKERWSALDEPQALSYSL